MGGRGAADGGGVRSLPYRQTADGRRQTADGRRQTADGRRKTEDGRRKTEDGRRKTEDGESVGYGHPLWRSVRPRPGVARVPGDHTAPGSGGTRRRTRRSAHRGLGPARRTCSRQGNRVTGTGTGLAPGCVKWRGGRVSHGAAVAWVTGASRDVLSACPLGVGRPARTPPVTAWVRGKGARIGLSITHESIWGCQSCTWGDPKERMRPRVTYACRGGARCARLPTTAVQCGNRLPEYVLTPERSYVAEGAVSSDPTRCGGFRGRWC